MVSVTTIQQPPSSMLNPKISHQIQQPITPQTSAPEFKLTQYEISCIKLIWNSLNLVNTVSTTTTTNLQNTTRIGLLHSTSSGSLSIHTRKLSISSINSIRSITNAVSPTSTTSQLPIVTYNDSNYIQFQYDLCTLVFNRENHTYNEHLDSDDDFNNVLNEYQILELINLICILINYLEFNKVLPTGYIIKLSKQNSRIYDYDIEKYTLFGECLINNIMNYINHSGNDNERALLSLENQISLNKFISQFLNILAYHGNEVIIHEFDSYMIPTSASQPPGPPSSLLLPPTMPVTVHSRNPSITKTTTNSTLLTDSHSNITINSSPSSKVMSETSSQLSLYKSNDMDHDTSRSMMGHDDDDNVTISSSGDMKKSYVKPVDEETSSTFTTDTDDTFDDEDDSFDYLNSFSSSNSNKKKRLSILKKKSTPSSNSRNGNTNTLSRMNTNTSVNTKYSTMTNNKRMPSQLSTTTTNSTLTNDKKKNVNAGPSDSIYARGSNGSDEGCIIM
ncbi:hypothetical protein DFJ63DRAFT_332493 [Scheffersomyces coipomensis]|uniref:uncharacterized protein n=1 Tax=Scheffersomyces coipomensis TaxID=1788519 RepID=UPI00315CAC99